jgi:hypothetical protein
MTKVLFFTAGLLPTTEEKAAITALESSRFEVQVRNAAMNVGAEACDFVSGAAPAPYDAIPEWVGTVPAGGAVVTEGQALNVSNSAGDIFSTSAIHIEDGEAAWTNLPVGATMVLNNQEAVVPVTGVYATKAKFTVAGGKITAIVLS